MYNPPIISKLNIGQKAPDFRLPDLEGHLVTLSGFQGRPVVINFWSAECPWSERIDRHMIDWLDEWKGCFAWLTIASNVNESPAEIKKVAAERFLPVVLFDNENKVADRYGAITTPHYFLIDGEGYLAYQGAFDDVTFRQREPTRFFLHQAIEALLSAKKPDPAETTPYGCTIVRIHPGG